MWIFACGMMRSGSTLHYQIVSQLVEDAGIGTRLPWSQENTFSELREQYKGSVSWKVLKVHEMHPAMRDEFQNGAMGVYIYRDIRDVVVSMSRLRKQHPKKIIKSNFVENQIENFRQWTQQPRVLISRYEDVIANLPYEIERVALHLNIPVNKGYCEDLAQSLSLENQKLRISDAIEKSQIKVLGKEVSIDPHSLLHTNHIQDGAIDAWKEILSLYEIAKIETIAADWLTSCGYGLSQKAILHRLLLKYLNHKQD